MTVIFKKKPAQRIMGNTTARTGPMPVSECDLKDNFHDDHRTRTKAGIAQARARGVSWGKHGKVLARKNQQEAKAFTENLRPLLLEMGCKIFRGATTVARELNGRNIPTPRGGRWHPTSVICAARSIRMTDSQTAASVSELKVTRGHGDAITDRDGRSRDHAGINDLKFIDGDTAAT